MAGLDPLTHTLPTEMYLPILDTKWQSFYRMHFLNKKDFEDATLEDLIPLIERKWQQFLENDLPKIHDSIMNISFE